MFKSSLTLKADLYFGDQNEEMAPITDVKFYLLDQDLPPILMNAELKLELENERHRRIKKEGYLFAAANAFFSNDTESEIVKILIENLISKHTIYVFKIDDFGQADIQMRRQGNYYLFGVSNRQGEIFVWNLPIEIKFGDNLIEIDQSNARVF